jgi:hypothetical protein
MILRREVMREEGMGRMDTREEVVGGKSQEHSPVFFCFC